MERRAKPAGLGRPSRGRSGKRVGSDACFPPSTFGGGTGQCSFIHKPSPSIVFHRVLELLALCGELRRSLLGSVAAGAGAEGRLQILEAGQGAHGVSQRLPWSVRSLLLKMTPSARRQLPGSPRRVALGTDHGPLALRRMAISYTITGS